MSYIELSNIKNLQHRQFIKKISDIFDQNYGKITGHLGLTRFDNFTGSHTLIFNTLSPEFNGKQLVTVGTSGLLYSITDIEQLVSDEPENNNNIGLLKQPENNLTWEAKSANDTIRLVIKLKEISQVNGFSIVFDDAVDTTYKIKEGVFLNSENEIISKIDSVVFSDKSNGRQFVQLVNKIEDIDRIVLDIECADKNRAFGAYVWSMSNITIYSYMDMEALTSLGKQKAIIHIPISNPVLLREGPKDTDMLLRAPNQQNKNKVNQEALPSLYSDKLGSALPLRPITDLQFIDEVDKNQMTRIANIPPTAVTKLSLGQVFSFVPDINTNNVTLTLSPTEQLNQFSDEAITQFPQLIEKGYIKKGGFKNYVLTVYLKLSNIVMSGQNLVWKYGGWLFNAEYPDLSRCTAIHIPIQNPNPIKAYSEYVYKKQNRIVTIEDDNKKNSSGLLLQSVVDKFAIEADKWYGFQFVRQVISPTRSIQRVRVNTEPFNEDEVLMTNEFKDLFLFIDDSSESHRANTWGGINEIISITGARNVDVYGLSIYEVDPQS